MKTTRSSTAQNAFQLFYSTILSSGILALILIILANYLNTQEYAMISVAIAFSMIMGFFTDMGLSNVLLREGTKKLLDLNSLLGNYLKFRLFFLIISLLLSFFIIQVFYHDNFTLTKILFLLIFPMVIGLSMQSVGITYYQLQERMHIVGYIRILNSALLILVISVGMLLHASVLMIAFLFGFSYLISGIISMFLVLKNISINWNKKPQGRLTTDLGTFFISGLIILIIPHMGPIILEKTVTLVEVGIFAVAYRIPSALYQLPGVIAGAFFPVLFRYYHASRHHEHMKLNILQIKIMGYVGMLITIPLIHLSSLFVHYLFGEEWMKVVDILRYIAPILFLQSLSIGLADGLTTKGFQKRRTIIQFIVFILAIVGYLFASIHYQLIGAVCTAIIIELVSIIGFLMMNPSGVEIAKQALIPQLILFISSLSIILLLLKESHILATLTHIWIVLIALLLDKSIRERVVKYIKLLIQKRVEKRISIKETS